MIVPLSCLDLCSYDLGDLTTILLSYSLYNSFEVFIGLETNGA